MNNPNIDKDSLKEFREYQEKQRLSNIKLHKILIGILGIITLLLFCFTCILNGVISRVDDKNKKLQNTLQLSKDDNDKLNDRTNTLMVQLFATLNQRQNPFTLIFRNKDEYDLVRKYIYDKAYNETYMFFIKQAAFDDTEDLFFKGGYEYAEYYGSYFLGIETKNEDRFGAYFNGTVITKERNENLIIRDDTAFGINGNKKKKYPIKINSNNDNDIDIISVRIEKGGRIIFGNEDGVIEREPIKMGGFSNFPQNYHYIDNTSTSLNEGTGKHDFEITKIELYYVVLVN